MKRFFICGAVLMLIFSGCNTAIESDKIEVESNDTYIEKEEQKKDFESDLVYQIVGTGTLKDNAENMKNEIVNYRKQRYDEGVDIWIPEEIGILEVNYNNQLYKNTEGNSASMAITEFKVDDEKITLVIDVPAPNSVMLAYNNYFEYIMKDELGDKVVCNKTDFRVSEDGFTSYIDFYSDDIDNVKWITIGPYKGRVNSNTSPTYFINS